MRKIELGDIGIVVLWIIVFVLLFALSSYEANAQAAPHVITTFEQGCIEVLDQSHYRIHFNYTSDGVETFTFKMGDIVGVSEGTLPYKGHATTNTPATFKTIAGYHDAWYLSAQSEDSPYTFNLMLTDDLGSVALPLNVWNNQESFDNAVFCEAGKYSQAAPVQNAPMPLLVINNPIVAAVQVVSTGRTCTVKYPEIILVCGG